MFRLIMPMAGRGSRFAQAGFAVPKPLIEFHEHPFFFWAVQSVLKFARPLSLDFVVLQEHVERFALSERIHEFYPDAGLVVLPEVTAGAVITALKGCEGYGDQDECPLFFNDCDHLFKSTALSAALSDHDNTDGYLLTFKSTKPRYSFVGRDQNGAVNRTVEKVAVSDEAICGCYGFKSTRVFRQAAQGYLANCPDSEYFMSGVYNSLLQRGLSVKTLPCDFHLPFGTPQELTDAQLRPGWRELL